MLRSNTIQWANGTGVMPAPVAEGSGFARRKRAKRRLLRQRLVASGHLLIRSLFVAMSGLLLLYGVSSVLATIDLFWVRFAMLMVWACGFLPICYGLWCVKVPQNFHRLGARRPTIT